MIHWCKNFTKKNIEHDLTNKKLNIEIFNVAVIKYTVGHKSLRKRCKLSVFKKYKILVTQWMTLLWYYNIYTVFLILIIEHFNIFAILEASEFFHKILPSIDKQFNKNWNIFENCIFPDVTAPISKVNVT